MTDDIRKRSEIETPCVRICQLHPEAHICIGCFRSLAEIGAWSQMSPGERRRLMAELPSRAAGIQAT
jgi:uncharacterized protein